MLVTKALRSTNTTLLKTCTTYGRILVTPTPISCNRYYGNKPEKPDNRPPPTCQSAGRNKCNTLGDKACGKKIPKKKKSGAGGFQFMHLLMLDKELCCEDICPDVPPRFDQCLYKASDKAKRKYQQTWVECPKIEIKPKEVCCYPQFDLPPVPRRKPRKSSTKKTDDCDSGVSKCPRIRLPGCRAANEDVKCKREKRKADCKKVYAPYPAYSECDRPPTKPKRKTECECLRLPPTCIVYKILRRMEKAGRSLKCP